MIAVFLFAGVLVAIGLYYILYTPKNLRTDKGDADAWGF